MDNDHTFGLSSKNRNYIVTLVFFALLLFGPVGSYGLAIRLLYLISVPACVWLILRFLGEWLDIDARTNDHINRALTAGIAGMFAMAAYLSFTADTHHECTRYVPDGDGGRECIGDVETKDGPDVEKAVLLTLLAGAAFWIATARRSDEHD